MSRSIYIVKGKQGKIYETYEWNVRAYFDYHKAKELADRLNERLYVLELENLPREKQMAELCKVVQTAVEVDPSYYADIQYVYTNYYIDEIQVHED